MNRIFLVFLLAAIGISRVAFSQGAPPWERPLMICYSTDGINFTPPNIFQDSSGVPSVTMDSTGKLIAAFQWFPAPQFGPHWDSVGVKFSLDSGITWSAPESIVVQNLPLNFQRPFDPTVVTLPNGLIRIYFSSGPPGMNTISTYSAIGTDGINYIFEPGPRFSQSGSNVIDPAVTIFRDTFQYTAPKGAPQDGSFHAWSTDGINFTQMADIVSDSSHQWTGNLFVDSLAMKFYGSGARGTNVWFRSTPDGNVWSPYVATNATGGDPAVIKIRRRGFVMIYTGPPTVTSVNEMLRRNDVVIYPNPANGFLHVALSSLNRIEKLCIVDLKGREVSCRYFKTADQQLVVDISELNNGIYFFVVENENEKTVMKFSVAK